MFGRTQGQGAGTFFRKIPQAGPGGCLSSVSWLYFFLCPSILLPSLSPGSLCFTVLAVDCDHPIGLLDIVQSK